MRWQAGMENSDNKINIPLPGLNNERDARAIDREIEKLNGVISHKVDYHSLNAEVEIDPKKLGISQLIKIIQGLGYKVDITKKIIQITGMSCASCAISAESILSSLKGIVTAQVNFANTTAMVEFFPHEITLQEMKMALQSVGYDLIIEEEETKDNANEIHKRFFMELKIKAIWSVVLALPVMIIGMFFMDWSYGNWIMMIISSPILFWFGGSFFINAYKQARHGKANMDTLVALSTGIAFIFSVFNTLYPEFWYRRGVHPHVYFEASAVVVAFILAGKVLEENAKANTSSAIRKLIGLQPKTVCLIDAAGKEMEILISIVKVGNMLLVKPGERIPVDGEVYEGESFVDESMMSGESLAVRKKKGDKIFAGTLNQRGSFKFIALKVGSDTMLAQIIRRVREAQGSKAPVQKMADKIAGIFVPAVIGISMLTFILWMIFGGENGLTHGLLSAITVLVIACPCALGLATPTAIMVGVGKGAENGILIRDAESLELAQKIDTIVLDKTGTITEGKPEVTDIIFNNATENKTELKQILLAIESQSEHPLADAICKNLKKDKIIPVTLEKIESVTGRGARAVYSGNSYFIGNKAFMIESKINLGDFYLKAEEKFLSEAKTIVYFSNDSMLLAILAINDRIKSSAKEAINILQKGGITVHMLTGDNAKVAEAVAKQVGITHFKSSVMPSGKAAFIKELQKSGKVVAMVGDGINDSQALAQADVSIAMGRGSDIAIDVAKMTIISSDLLIIPKAIRLSKLTFNTIKQNLFWAFIYNIIGIPIAAGVLYPINGFLINPMVASAAMALSSVSVVFNSLRIRGKGFNTNKL